MGEPLASPQGQSPASSPAKGTGASPGKGKAFWLIMALALAIRALGLFSPNLDADMAVTGLMASHILEGHFPIFFYGQPFAGAIEAYIAAPIFALLGPGPITLCLAPTLVSLVFVWLAFLVGRDMWGRRAGLFCMALAALPPYFFLWHSVLPRGCYIEIPTISLALVWLAWRLAHRGGRAWTYLLYGLLAGVGFWTHFLIIYALAASALYLVLADWRVLFRRSLPLMLAGFILGATPLWIYNLFVLPGGTATYLMALPKGSSATEALLGLAQRAWPTLVGAVWDGSGQALAPVYTPALLGISLAILACLLWQRRQGLAGLARFNARLCDGSEIFLLLLLLVVVITTLKGENAGATRRHFVPAYAALIPLAGYAAARLHQWRPALGLGLLAAMLTANLIGVAVNSPAFNQTLAQQISGRVQVRQDLIEALLARGITRAYSLDYWNCSSLTFQSGQRLIVVQPQMELDHFYEPHARLVTSAPSQAWVCRWETTSVRNALEAMGAGFQTLQVGPYTVFHDLVPPQEGWQEISRQGWRAWAKPLSQDAGQALDADVLTRWSPLAAQEPGQTFTLDMGRVVEEVSLVRLCSGRDDDHPRGINLEISTDGQNWQRVKKASLVENTLQQLERTLHWAGGAPRAAVNNPRLDLSFKPQAARFLRLIQTGRSKEKYWSLMEISVYTAAPAVPRDPQALLARVRQTGIRHLYAEEVLQSHLPGDLRPIRRKPPVNPIWPVNLLPRSVLPADLSGVGLAVEAQAEEELARFLSQRRHSFQHELVGGYSLFWDLRPPADREIVRGMAGARANSSNPGGEAKALDSDPATRWDSGRPRRAGDFFALDLGQEQVVSGLRLNVQAAPRDLPPDLELSLSRDGEHWEDVPWQAAQAGPLAFADDRLLGASPGLLTLRFPPQSARHLRLGLAQGHPGAFWSLHDIALFGPTAD